MTSLPPPEQWVLCKMSEMELAEMIEEHIDYYTEDEDGNLRSVHLPTPFVRHFMQRHDGALPTVVAIATAPIVLADGVLLAPEGLDLERGIQFLIQDELRAVIPQGQDCTSERVKAAMEFLCDEWLVDVATDYTGKAIIIAAALTLIERSLLPDRPCFFITAGRRGNGKTTTIIMLIVAVTGERPAAAAWSSNEEERRKALMSYFLHGVPLSCGTTSRAARRSRARTSKSPAPRRTTPTAGSGSAKWFAPLLQPSTSSPATISGRRATWPHAASTAASTLIASIPRIGRSSTRTRSAGPRTTAPGSWRRSTPSFLGIPSSRHRATRRARSDLKCGGDWLALRSSTPPSWQGRSLISRNCSSSKRRTTRPRRRSPMGWKFG